MIGSKRLVDELGGKLEIRRWNVREPVYEFGLPTLSIVLFGESLTVDDYNRIFELSSVKVSPNCRYSLKINDSKRCVVFHDVSVHQQHRKACILYSSGYFKVFNSVDYKKVIRNDVAD